MFNKAFACVKGALACISVKSNLDRDQLLDSLKNLASIPATNPLDRRASLDGRRVSLISKWPDSLANSSESCVSVESTALLNFTLIIVSLLVYAGETKQRYPYLDFEQEAVPFVVATLAEWK
jgi:hypothetical protein